MSLPKRSYTVEGMTCGHCRASVIEEVLAGDGQAAAVEVDIDSPDAGHGEDLDDGAIREAVDEAGYTLVA